jgi:G:T-mismatch repair DNA endonuclease (very short patch repair protein)
MGQHSSCNITVATRCSLTRPATEAEYADLLAELEKIGYRVQVIKRINQWRYQAARKAEIDRLTTACAEVHAATAGKTLYL